MKIYNKYLKRITLTLVAFLLIQSNFAQSLNRKSLSVPNLPGFVSLKCDFHMHTVFSDGSVWPTVRVEEAYLEGLDAISITDHIEYLPYKKDIKSDHNRSFELAEEAAERSDIILIQGTEVTRNMPPGHLNAIFIKDANLIDTPKYKDALKAAKDQGAFIFWNHPGWVAQAPDGIKWYEEHTELVEAGLINGIEVVNYNEWYPEALQWCVEKDLTLFSNSDIHESLASFLDKHEVEHRPMTLVFAEERSAEGIKEALFAKRTLAWFDEKVIGKEEFLLGLAKASLKLSEPYLKNKKSEYRKLINKSSFHFYFEYNGSEIHLRPDNELIIEGSGSDLEYQFTIKNFIGENGALILEL